MHQQRQRHLLAFASHQLDGLGVAAVRATHPAVWLPGGVRHFTRRHHQRHVGRHAGGAVFDVKTAIAHRAAVGPALDGQRLDRHHRAAHDGCAVAAACHLAGAVFGPEGVDDLWAGVAVVAPLLHRQRQWVEAVAHHLLRRQVGPDAALTGRAVAGVKRHDLWLDLGLDVGQQAFDFGQVHIGQLLLDHEPGHRVQVIARHLHAQPRALHQRGAATHEDVGYFQVRKRTLLLVVGVVVVPYMARGMGFVVGRLGGGGNQHRAEYAAAPARPPLAHLVNRLAGIAFDHRHLVDRQDRKIHLQAGLGSERV